VGGSFGAIAFGVRYFAIERERVSGTQMSYLVADGEPHFTLNDKRLYSERVSVRLDARRWRPPPFQNFVESLRSRTGFESLKVKSTVTSSELGTHRCWSCLE